ncbi:MAG TPA: pyridoxal 5'-phosphate synthase glutaminase subunit PdxT [Chthonomonadaceae bacterium]|nr:pyridoxal 5'-phosphate synthase glutaminase subunit PdxT [Chthonomonadaceae bacterium]
METTEKQSKIIGILALQGDFDAHRKMLEEQVGAQTAFVRTPEELAPVDALVLPGGESTTIGKLMERSGLDKAIRQRAAAGMPLYGTCAGLILMAKEIEGRPNQPTLDLLDVRVARNAFGRQIDSFEADIPFALGEQSEKPVRGVFIRAPYITEAAPDVQVLSTFEDKIVGVRQGSLLGIAFHPELTDDPRIHAYFAQMVEQSQEKR